ncbi:MAG: NADH-quinone oxidoreductase subunit M [Saprospiraceae bacterium]|nr:NADH-quinone oxidoreductase subunit M [Saprospiraceae bacterium]
MLLAILLIIIPLAFSLISFVGGRKLAPILGLTGAMASLLYFLYLLSNYNVRHELMYNTSMMWIPEIKGIFHVGIDGYSVIPLLLTQIVILFSVFYSFSKSESKSGAYYGLIGLAHAALNGFFIAQNPITFYLFFELALIPMYFLVLNWGNADRRRAVFKFFIYTIFGSVLLLAAIIYIHAAVGANQLLSWKEFYFNSFPMNTQLFILVAIIIAFGIKSPLFPFHTWQASLYSNADKPTVIILSALMSKMGVFGLLRFVYPVMPAINLYQPWIIGLCIVGILYGALMAWKQTDMNKLLAYSSLSHIGLIAASIFILNLQAIEGALFQIFVHGICVTGLFALVGTLESTTGSSSIDASSGFARKNPRFATYFFIITLASIGLPLTAGFVGEFYMLFGLSEESIFYALFAGLSVILGAVYMFRFYQNSMFGNAKEVSLQSTPLKLNEEYIFIIISILVIIFGFFPRMWIDFAGFSFLEYLEYLPK